MASSSSAARLADILEAIELICAELAGVTIQAFQTERRKQWLVERGLEIISEASRRLPEAMKAAIRSFHGPRLPESATSFGTITSTSLTTCYGASCMMICPPWKEFAAKSWPPSKPVNRNSRPDQRETGLPT
jgi:hypothetical protein